MNDQVMELGQPKNYISMCSYNLQIKIYIMIGSLY